MCPTLVRWRCGAEAEYEECDALPGSFGDFQSAASMRDFLTGPHYGQLYAVLMQAEVDLHCNFFSFFT